MNKAQAQTRQVLIGQVAGLLQKKRFPKSAVYRPANLQNNKPIPSRSEDSLPIRKTEKLRRHGWNYNPNKGRSGAWVPPKYTPPSFR